MNRHEEMKKIIDEMTTLATHYTDGLILDVEYLNKAIDLMMTAYPSFSKCSNCGEEKSYDHMHRDGIIIDDVWNPICNDCFKFHHRTYLCVWGGGYAPHGKVETKEQSFGCFRPEDGYSLDDIDAIDKLVLGECHKLYDGIASMHSVVRIK
jgi:hypothetical protein